MEFDIIKEDMCVIISKQKQNKDACHVLYNDSPTDERKKMRWPTHFVTQTSQAVRLAEFVLAKAKY